MNSQLKSALAELSRSGAQGLPSPGTIEKAKNGTSWKGTKKNSDPWGLTKNSEDSYNCMC